MEKLFCACICISVLLFAAGCEKKVPLAAEMGDFYKEMIQTTNGYADRLDAVKDSKEASRVLREYVDDQKVMIEKGKKMREKYPDFKFHDDPALKEYEKSLEDATIHFASSMSGAVKKYMANNEFRQAFTRFQEIAREAEKEK